MKQAWILTCVVVLYALSTGLLMTSTPQAVLRLQFSSFELGLTGAGVPLGYALSCLACGRLLRGVPAKYVLLCGIVGAAASLVSMAYAASPVQCVLSQIGYGLASGAFWPFASSGLLDFAMDGIAPTRMLRHYNVGWTSGTAAGMLLAGFLCEKFEAFKVIGAAAGVMLAAGILALPLPAIRHTPAPAPEAGGGEKEGAAGQGPRIVLALLLAAVLANLAALGTRTMILNTYAELNKSYHFGAERMGVFAAVSLIVQTFMFGFGALYEEQLGLRRVYAFSTAGLVAVNLAFAFSQSLPLLTGAVILHGVVLALAFQCGIFAATGFFATIRAGTTFHEASIGAAGIAPLLAGALIAHLKAGGMEEQAALRAPFLVMSGLAVLLFALQWLLVSPHQPRALLWHGPSAGGNRQ